MTLVKGGIWALPVQWYSIASRMASSVIPNSFGEIGAGELVQTPSR
jgi:hypothetical protein